MKTSTFKKLLSMRDELVSLCDETDADQSHHRRKLARVISAEFDGVREALNALCAYELEKSIPYPNPDSRGERTITYYAPWCDIGKKDRAGGLYQHGQNGKSRGSVTKAENKIQEAASTRSMAEWGESKRRMVSGFMSDILEIISEECGWDSAKTSAAVSEKEKIDRYLSAFETPGPAQ